MRSLTHRQTVVREKYCSACAFSICRICGREHLQSGKLIKKRSLGVKMESRWLQTLSINYIIYEKAFFCPALLNYGGHHVGVKKLAIHPLEIEKETEQLKRKFAHTCIQLWLKQLMLLWCRALLPKGLTCGGWAYTLPAMCCPYCEELPPSRLVIFVFVLSEDTVQSS